MTTQSSRPSRRRFVTGSAAALPALYAAAAGQGEAQEQPADRTAPARPLNIVADEVIRPVGGAMFTESGNFDIRQLGLKLTSADLGRSPDRATMPGQR
jgi:hypothetical protein